MCVCVYRMKRQIHTLDLIWSKERDNFLEYDTAWKIHIDIESQKQEQKNYGLCECM